MSSRKQTQNKPYWKRKTGNPPGYTRQYGFNEDGTPATDPVTGERIYRDVPNRAMKRMHYAAIRKGLK